MRPILYFFLLLTNLFCYANMASPIRRGTAASTPFSSRDIDILNEKIYLTIDKNFQNATYQITYTIRTDTSGKQIPLLFHAQDFGGNFSIWVDDTQVMLQDIPEEYLSVLDSPFEKFSDAFIGSDRGSTFIHWDEETGDYYRLNDLKYVEVDLSKGQHTIRVTYTATAWKDVSEWVSEYSFRYSLSPAQYWKSFGTLDITVDARAVGTAFNTNIGNPVTGQTNGIATWHLTKLPAEYWSVTFTPAISSTAKFLIAVDPFGLTLLVALVLVGLHLWAVWAYRRSHLQKRFSWVVIAGSIIIPFVVLVCYMLSYNFIDIVIGQAAGRYHGYTFLVIALYPLLLIVYWLGMWLTDRYWKRKSLSIK